MKQRNGFAMISLVLALVVLALLYMFAGKKYFSTPRRLSDQTQKAIEAQGVDAAKYADVVQSAKDAMGKANKAIRKKDAEAKDMLGR